jgi:preprotein translocase subunit Sec61beta
MTRDRKNADRTAQEIEITEAMVTAGLAALWEERELQIASEPEALVRAVYAAMEGARVCPVSILEEHMRGESRAPHRGRIQRKR